MTELRWILLVAGLVLIAGIYAWGLRSRSRAGRTEDVETRPAVFTGGAAGFERSEPEIAASDLETEEERRLSVPAASRRLEPSISLDDSLGGEAGADIDFDDGVTTAPGIKARREPTLSPRPEPVATSGRIEPALRPRAAPPAIEPEVVTSSPRAAPAATPAPPAGEAKPSRGAQRIFALRVTATPPERFDGRALLEALQAESLAFGRYDIFHRLHTDGRPIFSVASLKEPGRFDQQAMPATQYPGIALFAVLPGPVEAAEAFDEMLFTARALATRLTGTIGDERGVPMTATRVAAFREEVLEFERSLGSA